VIGEVTQATADYLLVIVTRAVRACALPLLLLSFLVNCGGRPLPAAPFVNQTRHSDLQLLALWKAAQENLSQEVDLNPLERVFTGAPPKLLPGDPRVWNIFPEQLVVASESDTSSTQLYAATGDQRPDPTGLIPCPQPCNVHYAPAYSRFQKPITRYAASWEQSESNFEYLLTYEFENQILSKLGYDMKWR
jgi:hypothetical protein